MTKLRRSDFEGTVCSINKYINCVLCFMAKPFGQKPEILSNLNSQSRSFPFHFVHVLFYFLSITTINQIIDDEIVDFISSSFAIWKRTMTFLFINTEKKLWKKKKQQIQPGREKRAHWHRINRTHREPQEDFQLKVKKKNKNRIATTSIRFSKNETNCFIYSFLIQTQQREMDLEHRGGWCDLIHIKNLNSCPQTSQTRVIVTRSF